MPQLITGLDLGGAHLKAAQVTQAGHVVAALQLPCALWLGLDRLEQALAAAAARLEPIDCLAITMTGELADLFPDRAAGVARLVAATLAALPGARPRIWAGRLGFVAAAEAAEHAVAIASANWLATGALAAGHGGDGLLVDLGSTTTDILVLAGGLVRAEGTTDRQRLATGELVYTGLTRTPVMALAAEVPFAGRRVALMNELFASSADLYRVLGTLPEAADQHAAADNGLKTATDSARRLARMIGADLADGTMTDWRRLAAWLARCQLRRIEDAVALQLSRGLLAEEAPVIGAGCGRFLLEPLARDQNRPYRDLGDLLATEPAAAAWAATCAPAVAVALLLAGEA